MSDIVHKLLIIINNSNEKDIDYNISWIILQNLNVIPTLSINQLADLCYVSISTISRFCRKLGCTNFSEFKNMLIYEENEYFNPRNKSINMNVNEDATNLVNMAKKNIDLATEALKIEEIDELASQIHEYKNVAFVGLNTAQTITLDLQGELMVLGKFATVFIDIDQQLENIKSLDKDSLLIILSASGGCSYTSRLNDALKQSKARKVLLTQNKATSLQQYISKVILYGNEYFPFVGRYALLYVKDMLIMRYRFLFEV
ncbi:MurR/RpiR family transcriptional regulator [Clostridium sp. C8-1-8]|uniref:MurR/RpiR family transcriptional regulator n=1 Tax=Clostridium sp. C8-1-8 TaxID=2698831 RepID=UPI0013698B5F|nr:MurR/RpiR family transcriptional regulator [Clostridium sp. C8-1-8]